MSYLWNKFLIFFGQKDFYKDSYLQFLFLLTEIEIVFLRRTAMRTLWNNSLTPGGSCLRSDVLDFIIRVGRLSKVLR